MNLYQFNALDEMEQAEAVWSSPHIGDRQEDEHNILLYQVDSFYVEAWYHREHNVLVKFRSFASTDQLEPYARQINLASLLK